MFRRVDTLRPFEKLGGGDVAELIPSLALRHCLRLSPVIDRSLQSDNGVKELEVCCTVQLAEKVSRLEGALELDLVFW